MIGPNNLTALAAFCNTLFHKSLAEENQIMSGNFIRFGLGRWELELWIPTAA